MMMIANSAPWSVDTGILIWVATYAIHSTLLIASVWLVTSLVPRLSLAMRETLWKVALVGGFVTASVQLGVGLQSPTGEVRLPAAFGTEFASPSTMPSAGAETPPGPHHRVVRHRRGNVTITAVRDRKPAATAGVAAPQATPPTAWLWVVLGALGLGSAVAAVRLAQGARKLRAQLRGRRDVIEDPILESFLALCNKAGLKRRVKLTASSHLRSPVALRGREIVIPERSIEGLDPRQQQSMLAHELAHVIRRDPEWMVLATIIEAICFFQPLNHLARRKLQHTAEYLCDDWAAETMGTGVHLAKCLAEVAGWVEGSEPASAAAVSMADEGSPVVRRITRLLTDKRWRARQRANPVWLVGTTVLLLGAVGVCAPRVSRAAAVAPSPSPEEQVLAAGLAESSRGELVVHDITDEDGRTRSQVRIDGDDESLRVDVESDPPSPPPHGSHFHIRIHGGVSGPVWTHRGPFEWFALEFGEHGFWAESLDLYDAFHVEIDTEDLADELEDLVDAQRDLAEARAEAHAELREAERELRRAHERARREKRSRRSSRRHRRDRDRHDDGGLLSL